MDYVRYWSDGYQLGGGVRWCIDLTGPRMTKALLLDLATLEHTRVELRESEKFSNVIELTSKEARRMLKRLNHKAGVRVGYRKDYVEKARQWLKGRAQLTKARDRALPKGHMDDKNENAS
jgi:hypothetical protein